MTQFRIPNSIIRILTRLEEAGWQAWLVGGCVRDGLMALTPHDWDICTDAEPTQVQQLFPDSLDYGMRHGTVTVRWEDCFAEVTTFRAEGVYSDHRRPDQVTFIKDLDADLARRDFTVNAIAMDARGRICDPFGGAQDLQAGILRAVGNPQARFQEDALRMLRAIRFSAQLGFTLEADTRKAVKDCAPLVSSLAAERVCTELEKTLLTERPEQAELMCRLGLLRPWGINQHVRSLDTLRSLPSARQLRWMGYALTLPELSPLSALRLDKKTITACEAVSALSAAARDEICWKAAVNQYGSALATDCAVVLGNEDLLNAILSRGDCCRLEELAVGGQDALAAGLKGSRIREALSAALRHVWAHPEDNTPETLNTFLREEAANHG